MGFDDDIHHRRSIRLKGYDYSQEGGYFVTICVQNRECLFGKIVDGEMRLNEAGRMVCCVWNHLSRRFPTIELGEFIVMPNHFHGIIKIERRVGAIHPIKRGRSLCGELPLHEIDQKKRRRMLLPRMIGYFKMNTAKQINLLRNRSGISLWQRNYYEHIIRDQGDHDRITEYILTNPLNWDTDEENPLNWR